MNSRIVSYQPAGPTLAAFHRSNAFVRGIRGPVGSGKSVACAMELLTRAQEQAPGPDGIRRSKWAVIRNTYPELKTTTIATWRQWCPTDLGRFVEDSPIVHHIRTDDLDMEVQFLALDRDDDVRKLLSLELTGAWINEAREVPKAILDALTARVGRYPPRSLGGPSWSGVILDSNPPDAESWWYKAAEVETPEGWEFFSQPSGLSDEAENIENLPNGRHYYHRIMAGKDDDWIKAYVHGEYAFVQDGKPVWPMYRDGVHVAREPLEAIDALPLLIGADFGLTPAAVIGQRLADGQWRILDEICTEDTGAIRFAEVVTAFLARRYPDHNAEGWGDPAGSARAQTDEKSVFDILRAHTPYRWRPAPTNDFTMRREAVAAALNRLVDGKPGILISPTCTTLRKALSGGYHYRKIQASGGETFHEKPSKNRYSHPAEALQYLLSGGGEASVALGRRNRGGNTMTVILDRESDGYESGYRVNTETGAHTAFGRPLFDF